MLCIHWDLIAGPTSPYPRCEHDGGCVLAPKRRKSFGFAGAVRWTLGTFGVLTLLLLFLLGHEIEVVIGVVAAAFAAAVTELLRPARRPGHGGSR